MIGTKLAHYEITSHIGSGGMGDVYQAIDTKLGRSVAIKFLSEAFSYDTERVARFQHEARVLASLNHSNIAAIHGLEEIDSRHFLVMELVSGETLAERIKRGAIPIEEALPIAKQIAEALEAAHAKGIIHRDLKPANIKVSPDGKVKVLDFGLAKAFQGEQNTTLSNSPTLMSGSVPGLILGTAAYMSPEQAKGKETDRTLDVWAFGCVLYEMLTGRTVFQGETIGEILAEVFKSAPDWTRLPADTPPAIRRLLRRCLQKDSKLRLRDIGDARIEIHETQSGVQDAVVTPVAATSRREWLAWISSLALVVLMAAAGIVWMRRAVSSVPPASEMRLEITTPPASDPSSIAISPDGRKIVFEATTEGVSRLWLRSLDSVSARPLERTDNAIIPFWSPDSRSVGFFADGKLKSIDIDGGIVQTLATAARPRGGTWNSDGTILFGPAVGLFRIPAIGGEPVGMTGLDGGAGFFQPYFLPDGRHFLYFQRSSAGSNALYVGQIDGLEKRRLLDAESSAVYVPSGQLLFVRQGTLFAQNFDAVRMEVTGNPFPVAENVRRTDANAPRVALSASAAGPIAYRAGFGSGQRQFVWFDRSGKEIAKVGASDNESSLEPSLSPDGRQVALRRIVNGNSDIWFLELERAVLRRFTFDDTSESFPTWSADGKRIVFGSPRKDKVDLYLKSTSGSGNEELLLSTAQNKSAMDWSLDAHFLLFRSQTRDGTYDLWAMSMDGERKPFPVVQTSFDEPDGQFSPDGKWIAYQSNESGRFEIYIQPFPGPGSKTRISNNGGAQLRWRRDGKELFYVALDGRLMAVPIQFGANGQAVEPGAPVPLFVTRLGGAVTSSNRPQYMVSRDGQRFLMNTIAEEAGTSSITVILNWKAKP